MTILAIDYGRRRFGLALAREGFIETKGFIEYQNLIQALTQLKKIILQEEVDLIVVGQVSGAIGREIQRFVQRLEKMIKLPIELVDETLTSWEAERLVGWRNKGRVDRVAAALILERYLDRVQTS